MIWRFLGSLSEARNSGCSGVYLITHNGKYNRVIYVGISINVGYRISQHYQGYLRGNRSIYRLSETQDVYTLMSSYMTQNHIKEYKKLAQKKKIWASTTIHHDSPKNLLASEQDFQLGWDSYVKKEYIPNLTVWALPFSSFDYNKAAEIESIIQSRLIETFDLRGYFNLKSISILGKIEFPNQQKMNLKFNNIPELDPVSIMVLDSLNEDTIPESVINEAKQQLESLINERNNEKNQRLSDKNKRNTYYTNNGTPWSQEELEKLRVMLTDFEMSPMQISGYLRRKPSSIAKRINNNDKFSANMWRKGLKWL
jgi:predicted GIY-YIG superfamily endonuclease